MALSSTNQVTLLCILLLPLSLVLAQYADNWASLNSRPLPQWYDDAKFGIYIHWGVYSVPGIRSGWFWMDWRNNVTEVVKFMKDNYSPKFSYPEFASQFTAELFEPDHWADLLKASGAKYVILLCKHHDGYTLWPSKMSFNWNSMDTGPKRDLVGDLATSVRNRTDIHFGLSYILYDWYNPLYLQDKQMGFKENTFTVQRTYPELMEMVNKYHPHLIWAYVLGQAPSTYLQSTKFLAWLYNESPVKDFVIVNGDWGSETNIGHGVHLNPTERVRGHKWEKQITLDRSSWSFRRNADYLSYLSIEDIIGNLTSTVSKGGNLLLIIGPTKDGIINPIIEERLHQVGQWLEINGEAIYGTVPWLFQNDSLTENIWYTSKVIGNSAANIYAIVLKWPKNHVLILGSLVPSDCVHVTMLGWTEPLMWSIGNNGTQMEIQFPNIEPGTLQWAWVINIKKLKTNK